VENPKLPKWPRVPEGQKLQFRKKILMFSVFLLLSVFIWLLNALSKNYTSVIEFPLSYSELPENRVFVGELPDHLDLSINAHGYALLRYKLFRKPVPIDFKLASYTLNRQAQDPDKAYLLTRYLEGQVAVQLPSELQLLEINPDTLFFEFADRVSRRVALKARVAFELDRQFTTVDGIVLEPDSIDVSGPDAILDTLSAVWTEALDLGLLSRNYAEKLELEAHQDLSYELNKVQCRIDLERITEVQLQVEVEVEGLPDTLRIQTFPARVKLVCRAGLSKYERIENHPFRAVARYGELEEGSSELRVHVENAPAYLLGMEYMPRSVEFLTSRR